MVNLALVDGQGVNLWEVVLHSGSVAKVVLLILGLFSLVSWVVIFQKAVLLTRSRGVTDKFRGMFRRATDWRELKAMSSDFTASPLLGLFSAGYSEVTYQLRPAQAGARAHTKQTRVQVRTSSRRSICRIRNMTQS